MTPFRMNDMTISLPGEITDQTVNVLMSGSGQVSINITRDDLKPDDPFPGFVSRELKKVGKKLPRFFLIGERARPVGSLGGYETRYQLMMEGGMVYQHQVYVPYYGKYLTITAAAPKKLAAQADAALETVLAGIKFRKLAS